MIIAPFYNMALMRHAADKKTLVVDYVKLKELTHKIDTVKKMLDSKLVETPRVEINRQAEMKKEAAAKPLERDEQANIGQREAKERTPDTKAPSEEEVRKEARVKATKEYGSYYQLLRERIRRRLKANYRSYSKEGEVYVTFTLASDGSMVSIKVDQAKSSADKRLQELAMISAKEAAPFPKFPKVVSLPKMSFSVLISFKKR